VINSGHIETSQKARENPIKSRIPGSVTKILAKRGLKVVLAFMAEFMVWLVLGKVSIA
jgi:hypothetical protein